MILFARAPFMNDLRRSSWLFSSNALILAILCASLQHRRLKLVRALLPLNIGPSASSTRLLDAMSKSWRLSIIARLTSAHRCLLTRRLSTATGYALKGGALTKVSLTALHITMQYKYASYREPEKVCRKRRRKWKASSKFWRQHLLTS